MPHAANMLLVQGHGCAVLEQLKAEAQAAARDKSAGNKQAQEQAGKHAQQETVPNADGGAAAPGDGVGGISTADSEMGVDAVLDSMQCYGHLAVLHAYVHAQVSGLPDVRAAELASPRGHTVRVGG